MKYIGKYICLCIYELYAKFCFNVAFIDNGRIEDHEGEGE